MTIRLKLVICTLVFVIFVLTSPVSPALATRHTGDSAKPDLPLRDLLVYASGDINAFWQQSFASRGLRYSVPLMVPYNQPIGTPCGQALMNNAFYCSASNSIYYDYNFISRIYSQVGDYAAVSIIAHEWGHLVQTQLGISNGRYFSIQMELQADCFAGSYTKYAEATGKLEAGDLEEAGAGLFNAGDPKEMPWFAAQAHGKSMQRISAFLDGYNGRPCFSR